ncbi:MAG: diguanylate cyclase [Planctomycetota bacterium]|nr:MAG: diguanylate cyclase [Planctomycetota bacterium]
MAQLTIVEGEDRGKTFALSRREETLGSASENTIVLHDRRISAHHAQIQRKRYGYEIHNLDQTKALLVNGEVFKSTRLQHGDWVTIADTTFVFSEDDEPERENPEAQSIDTDDLLRSQIQARRKTFEDAESVIESLDRSNAVDQRLKTLFRLAHELSGIRFLRQLGDRLAREVLRVFDADRCVVLTMEDQRRLKPLATKSRGRGLEGEDVVSRTIIKHVLSSREALLCTDALDDDRFLSGKSIVDSNVRSFMCVPCIHQSQVVALILVDSTTERSFSAEDLDLLAGIAQFVAILMENCKAYHKGRDYNRQLFHLGRAIQQLSSYLDRNKVLKEAGKIACQQLGCFKASIILVGEDGRLRLESVQGMTKEVWNKIRGTDIGERFCRQVIEEGRPLLVQDLRELGYVPNPRYSSRSFLIVPIVTKSRRGSLKGTQTRIRGTIAVTDKTDGSSFTGNDQKILDILAGQLGVVLENAELYEKATVDSLTKVYLRRHFEQRLEQDLATARAQGTPLSLLILDIDHFKHTNDTYGHQAGDAVLRTLGRLLKKCVRPDSDTVARYGGEEFTIILPEADAGLAAKVAQRILRAVAAEEFPIGNERTIRKTVSIGIATVAPGERETMARLIKKADYALYEAKETGRNRSVRWSEELLQKLRRNARASGRQPTSSSEQPAG